MATSDAFKRHFANLGWAFERNRTSFGLNGEYSQEDYEQAVELDRSVAQYAVYVGRRLSPGLRLRLEARYFTEDFDTAAIRIDELQGIAALNWTVDARCHGACSTTIAIARVRGQRGIHRESAVVVRVLGTS